MQSHFVFIICKLAPKSVSSPRKVAQKSVTTIRKVAPKNVNHYHNHFIINNYVQTTSKRKVVWNLIFCCNTKTNVCRWNAKHVLAMPNRCKPS